MPTTTSPSQQGTYNMPTDSSEYKPTKKELVTFLMDFEGKETDAETGVTYVKYRCPKQNCANPIVRFRDNTGFSNPFSHLQRCFARGQTDEEKTSSIFYLYNDARKDAQLSSGIIRSHFTSRTTTEYERTVHGYIRLVVTRNLPLSIIEDDEFRAFSKFKSRKSYRTLCSYIFQLVKLVEKCISFEMINTVGAVMYDGWTGNNTNFVSGFASYFVETKSRINFTNTVNTTHR